MNIQYMTERDWKEWEESHPAARADMLHRCLVGEHHCLQKELSGRLTSRPNTDLRRVTWLMSRLADLERCGVIGD